MAFKSGTSGNPKGRPRGIADKRNLLRDALAKRGRKILDKMIADAEGGNLEAAKFLLSRLIPPARELPMEIEAADGSLIDRGESVLRATLDGRLTPDQCAALMSSLRAQADLAAHCELEERIARLEAKAKL